jgi:hypothetical protein
VRRLASAVVAIGLVGCGSSPAPRPAGVVTLAAGPASAYTSIAVVVGDRSVPVPDALRPQVAPLLGARAFTPDEPLSAYGLDRPAAHLRYVRSGGTAIDIAFGATTFDHHFVYAQRSGQAAVALVAASVADPLLVLAGVAVPSPV